MPDIGDLFPSKFLKASDLQGREPLVTIQRVEFESMGSGGRRETKAVLYFRNKQKGLKLNKTMATAISRIVGSSQTEAWVGKTVCLYATSASFGEETYPVVRVKAPAQGQLTGPRPIPAPVPTPAPKIVAATGTDGPLTLDDIPF